MIQHHCPASGHILSYDRPLVMGILNATPDSFHSGSRVTVETVRIAANQMIAEGADILDIGAMSSRPGAEEISTAEETQRLIPVLDAVRASHPEIVISVDTYRAKVARAARDHGADIINDITAGTRDPELLATVGELSMPYIMMHMQGCPETMQDQPQYDDLMLEMMSFFAERIHTARAAGVQGIIIDPGIGFGKAIEDNYHIIKHLRSLQIYDLPILMGLSRKSFLYKTLNISPDTALNATTAMHMLSLHNGANILRVHDVREAVECVRLYERYTSS